MTTLVVDSSVAPKWYVPEAHEREARRLLIPDYVLIAPSMLQVELTNIALQKVRRGQITVLESRRLAAAAWTDIPVRIVDSVPIYAPPITSPNCFIRRSTTVSTPPLALR